MTKIMIHILCIDGFHNNKNMHELNILYRQVKLTLTFLELVQLDTGCGPGEVF